MVKIYTKTGDAGKTSMLGGKRVLKSCLEMEAIGEVDELNAELGILIEECHCEERSDEAISMKQGIAALPTVARNDMINKLITVQNNLFVIGANLAALQSPGVKTCKLANLQTRKLEKWIDLMQKDLPELKNFILPGGCEEAALSFYARAVCRRAERCVIKLSEKYRVPPEIKKYLNRLSDLLFVLARWLNFKSKIKEVRWKG
jgi:cob(I)alamin adenosyltransferase